MKDRRGERLALAALGALAAITASWWLLALWPVSTSPDWLSRTRSVCFGTGPSGLPDAGGWILLVGQPLGMLAFLLMVWGRSVSAALRAAARRTHGRIAIAAGALLLVVGVAGAATRVARAVTAAQPGAAPEGGAAFRLDRVPPPLRLIDQSGKVFTLDEHRGSILMLTFAYAHCETICPLNVRDVIAARARIEGVRPIVVVVTVDPWRDTPARLPAIAGQWNLEDGDHALSGDTAEVVRVLARWNIPISRDTLTGIVDHPTVVYFIDRLGHIAFAEAGGVDRLAELARRSGES